ncbi:hypothetical protein U8527_16040 [Kordia algicida OT-1]|uniref:Uncharacterized protein n=1 Tax=Kordia algicida OT-1 TaxID=391587 RepID=A9E486_9FLAO|nr:hypothetical protein [Kordia algicida]EDP95332.1 hypothetical protein KAOT1_09676 [Kordia algicida OT-1]
MKEHYNFNPFAGVLDHEISHTIVPRFSVAEIASYIENNPSIAIEFLGKQGRGKTTHLIWLQQQLPHYPIFLLEKGAKVSEIIQHTANIVFVDSIHHLSFKERVQLFTTKKVVIYTTHYTRKISCLLVKKPMKTIRFKGIDTKILGKIIHNRLLLAQNETSMKQTTFSESELKKIIQKYGDNYRGIINKLYEKYQ